MIQFLLLTLMIGVINSPFTPDPGLKRRIVLLTANRDYYFTMIIQRSQPGSHIKYTDSTFVVKNDINTANEIERHLLRVTDYEYDFNTDELKKLEKLYKNISLQEFLLQNNSDNVYPSNIFRDYMLGIDSEGLFLDKEDGERLILVGSNELMVKTGLKKLSYLKYVTFYESVDHIFFHVQEGNFCCVDGNSYQFIIPVKTKNIRTIFHNSFKR